MAFQNRNLINCTKNGNSLEGQIMKITDTTTSTAHLLILIYKLDNDNKLLS